MRVAGATAASAPHPSVAGDRWLLWPVVAAITSTTALALLCGLPGLVSFLLIPLSVVAFPIVAITIIVWALVLGARRRFRKAGSVLLALLAPMLLLTPINWTAECLHLGLTVGFGAGEVGPRRPPSAPFWVYDWSVGLAGGPNTFLIRDETDEIALPAALHKLPIASEFGWGETCAGKLRRLLGHYYICIV